MFGVGFVGTLEDPPRTGDLGRRASISTERNKTEVVNELATQSTDGKFTWGHGHDHFSAGSL